MAKKPQTAEAPATNAVVENPETSNAVTAPGFTYFVKDDTLIPANAKKVSSARLVKPSDVPVGAGFRAKITGFKKNITGQENMREAICMALTHANGDDFLFPVSGVIRKSLVNSDGKLDEKSLTGKEIIIKRQPDGMSGKYKKTMFMFDVYLLPWYI